MACGENGLCEHTQTHYWPSSICSADGASKVKTPAQTGILAYQTFCDKQGQHIDNHQSKLGATLKALIFLKLNQ